MRKPRNNTLLNLLKHFNREVAQVNSSKKQYAPRLASRRKFMADVSKGALGTSLALSLPTLLPSCQVTPNSSPTVLDVAILGAGIAGLNCAKQLTSSTLKFKILEASHRNGGRILTHYNDALGLGIFPEFGGDFIDSNHTDMLELVKEFNLELIDLVEEQESKGLIKDIFYFENRIIEEAEVIAAFSKIAPKIALDIDSLGEEYDTEEAIALDQTPLSTYFDTLDCPNWLKELLTAAFIAEFGLDCSEQSTLNFLDMIDTDTDEGFKVFGDSDERFRIKEGNSKIIEHMVSKIGADKIHHEFEVIEITEDEQGIYHIHSKNGERYQAKKIVCTIPFSILRHIKLNLKEITAEKRACINELGYGTNTKLILGYTGTPWSDEKNKAMGYLFHKEMVNGWDSSHHKATDNPNGAYVCYFGGIFSEALDKLSSKSPFAPETHVWKTELPAEKVTGFVDELDHIFLDSKSLFSGRHVFANWIDFPYSRGSYSCYKVGQWSRIAGLEIEPIGNFYFAGEHCSEWFQGFMNGAAETGRRVGELLLQSL